MEKETKTTAETPPQIPAVPVGSQLPLTEVTADELAAPLAANMPEVTNSKALPGTAETPAPAAPVNPPQHSSAVKDRAGNVWDPAKYKAAEGGAPRVDNAGYFIPINKGRPKKDPNAPAKSEPVKSVMPEQKNAPAEIAQPVKSASVAGNGEAIPDEFDHAAELYFNMLIPLAAGILSEEWLPGFNYDEKEKPFIDAKQGELEKKSITLPLAAYMRVKGKTELSPGWALTLAAVGYSGRRAQMPKTREKAAGMFATVKGWFGYGKK